MKIIEYLDIKKWDQFLSKQSLACFLQSWQWGEWQKELGRKVWRFAILDNDGEILAIFQVFKLPLDFKLFKKNYLYLPYGPIFKDDLNLDIKKEIEKKLFEQINILAKEEKSVFLKIESLEEIKLKEVNKLKKVKDIQPANTWLLDLEASEEEILANMHSKTRYNIRLASKKGVQIEKTSTLNGVDNFFKILDSTSKRNQFGIQGLKYYKNLLNFLEAKSEEIEDSNLKAAIYMAKLGDKTIASIWVMYFGKTAVYLYGGLDKSYNKLMAPHLIQWQAICDAKKLGFKYYDFWGIAPENSDKNHPWSGLTRFKKSFGGFENNIVERTI